MALDGCVIQKSRFVSRSLKKFENTTTLTNKCHEILWAVPAICGLSIQGFGYFGDLNIAKEKMQRGIASVFSLI